MVPSYEVMSLSSGSQCFAREQQCKCVPDSKVHGVLSGPVGVLWQWYTLMSMAIWTDCDRTFPTQNDHGL